MGNVVINGKSYKVPEMDFNAVCELEERGVNILNLGENVKVASMVRGVAAWIMRTDLKTASAEIQGHIQNGGNIMDILDALNEAADESGFFKQGQEQASQKKIPMDHQRKQNKNFHGNNTIPSQRS